MPLTDKVAIITGASSGIGAQIAYALAAQGANVVLTARREDTLNSIRDQIIADGGQALVVPGDITLASTAETIVAQTLKTFGTVDILINNAGYAPPALLHEMDEDVWDTTLAVCLKSVYLMTHAVLPTLLEKNTGHILSISSVAGKNGYPRRTAYCAAKWGLQGFSAALREEIQDTDINVYTVNPGPVATEWWDTADDSQSDEVMARMIQPETIAEAVVYALSQPENILIDEMVVKTRHSPWVS